MDYTRETAKRKEQECGRRDREQFAAFEGLHAKSVSTEGAAVFSWLLDDEALPNTHRMKSENMENPLFVGRKQESESTTVGIIAGIKTQLPILFSDDTVVGSLVTLETNESDGYNTPQTGTNWLFGGRPPRPVGHPSKGGEFFTRRRRNDSSPWEG